MKNNLKTIALVLAVVLATVSLGVNYSLSQEIKNLRSSVNNDYQRIQNEVNGIYNNVDEMLQEKASLLEKSDCKYGKIDVSAGTAELIVSVLPKEYTTATVAKIVCENKEYPLEFSNGSYIGSVPLSLYKDYSANIDLIFTDGDTVRTETPEWYLSPVSMLPQLSVNEGNVSNGGTYQKDTYKAELKGTFEIQYYYKKDLGSLKELRIVHEVNGEIKSSEIIPLNTSRPEDLGVVIEHIEDDSEYSNETYYYEIDRAFEAPYDSTQAVYIEALDTNGLRYRTAVAQGTVTCKITRSHNYGEEYFYHTQIVAPDGKILWEQV